MEQMRGIEPPYQPWQGCVLPLNYICKKMAVQMGLEPTISSVTGRHVNHYTTGPCIFNWQLCYRQCPYIIPSDFFSVNSFFKFFLIFLMFYISCENSPLHHHCHTFHLHQQCRFHIIRECLHTPYNARLTRIALFIFSIVLSSNVQIHCPNRFLSIVRSCSHKIMDT